MDFRPEIQEIASLLKGEHYSAAARHCATAIEQAFRQILKQHVPKLKQEDQDKVHDALRKKGKKGLDDRLMVGDLDYVIHKSDFLDAWTRVSGKDPRRTRWFAVEGFRTFRNALIHEFQNVTKGEAKSLFTHLLAILEDFGLIDMNNIDNIFSSGQNPDTHVFNNTSEKTHSTVSFTHGHALIIGVGADLPNTITDAKGIAGILQDPVRCAYPDRQVTLLTGERATRKAVLSALDALAQTTDTESTVIIYFSGHGYQTRSTMGEMYYLLPYGYDLDFLYKTAISGAEFTNKLRLIPSKKLLVLLDCCHAGGIGDAKVPGLNITKKPLPPEVLPLFSEGRGQVLIASSKENELSFAGKPYSKFTSAIIEAFCGRGMAKQDGYVRVTDLALHAREVVPKRTKGRQHPTLHFEHADNFVLAYYAGGDTQLKDLPFAEIPDLEVTSTNSGNNVPDSRIEIKGNNNMVGNHNSSNVIKVGHDSKTGDIIQINKK